MAYSKKEIKKNRSKRRYPAVDANYAADGYSKLTKQFWNKKHQEPSECIVIKFCSDC